MVVQHNLTAMNSNRMLGLTTKSQAKSTEKLSSGYKINRAADDAAGLSISEKMRKQIRGLAQASSNAQDGISCVQTAEGALNEVQDMLQRMNELSVKAANGTNSEDDRDYIQAEINQLVSEVDRVSETTKFNETYLLKGDEASVKEWEYKAKVDTARTGDFSYTFDETKYQAGIGGNVTAADTPQFYYHSGGNWISLSGGATQTSDALGLAPISNVSDGDIVKIDLQVGAPSAGATYEVHEADRYGVKLYDKTGNRIAANQLYRYISAEETPTGTEFSFTGEPFYLDEKHTIEVKAASPFDGDQLKKMISDTISASRDITGALTLSLHVGADSSSNNRITLDLKALTAKGLGVEDLKVDGKNEDNACYSINVVAEAIQKISAQRSELGAIQNRLEHTINNLDNVVENTTAAESQIRDTDMAAEMVRYSNNNILAQAGQAMLAQANQSNQGVLSLLQG